MEKLLQLAEPPTAVLCGNDEMAFGAIRMEFQSSQFAQSMAVATAIAIESGNIDLQSVDYPTLRTRLLASPSYSGEVAPVLPQTN